MKLIIFDGNSIINRAYYAIRPLTNSEGFNANAVYGFFNILLKYINEEKPDYLACAFDLKAPTFRHKMYDKYKAGRKGMPDDLAAQLPVMKDLIRAMNIAILEKEGYEADDIIGTIAKKCTDETTKCIIVTGDRDSLQLINNHVAVSLATTKAGKSESIYFDTNAVTEKYGVTPEELKDVKALMGDSSDNIPGVAGIGEKTAYSLISEYKNIEYIYDNIDTLNIKDNLKQKLTSGKEMAFMSKKLGTIDCDVPFDSCLDGFKLSEYNKEELYKILKRLEFNSHIEKMFTGEPVPKKEKADVAITPAEFENLAIKDSLYFTYEKDFSYIYVSADDKIYKISIAPFSDAAKKIFEDEGIKKYSDNLKIFILHCFKNGINFKGGAFDSFIAAYLLNPSETSYDPEIISSRYSDFEAATPAEFAYSLRKISENMLTAIKETGMEDLLNQIEIPLTEVLASMEYYGFRVDKNALSDFSDMLTQKIDKLTIEIYALSEAEFNINSPKQLGEILFEKLGLPSYKKTKTGYSTGADVLEKLKGIHPVIDLISEYRLMTKLKSTYADGLIKVISDDGRIHTSFNQTITQTGRISSTEPNLQNIPIRHEMGANIRKMFIAENSDYLLLDADYSQIELRVLAHIANDKNMIEAFINNADIHTKTAAEVLGILPNMVTPLMRSRAKAVNFGIVYGIGDYSLSQDLHISRKEARSYIDNYLNFYSGVKKYMTDIVESAKETGYVTTLFGRRRYIPELNASNKNIQGFGQRVALNTPIQGTAADIIKISMVNVYKALKSRNLKSRLILQVHDELIIEAYISEIEEVSAILKNEMENSAKLAVPLTVEVKSGNTWYGAK